MTYSGNPTSPNDPKYRTSYSAILDRVVLLNATYPDIQKGPALLLIFLLNARAYAMGYERLADNFWELTSTRPALPSLTTYTKRLRRVIKDNESLRDIVAVRTSHTVGYRLEFLNGFDPRKADPDHPLSLNFSKGS